MIPTSRDELGEYCLRALGKPMLEVNVVPEQLDDRIDEAIQFYHEFHMDAIDINYIVHVLTQEDIDNNAVMNLPDAILSVSRVYGGGLSNGKHLDDLLNPEYALMDQFNRQGINDGLTDFYLVTEEIDAIDNLFNRGIMIKYARHKNELKFLTDISRKFQVGDSILIEAYTAIDPDQYPDVFNDRSLKKLATALIKKQWGQNLIKFEGMQLPGGVTLNGRQTYDDAVAEIQALEETWRLENEKPIDFYVG